MYGPPALSQTLDGGVGRLVTWGRLADLTGAYPPSANISTFGSRSVASLRSSE
jgi:hypothetical protein